MLNTSGSKEFSFFDEMFGVIFVTDVHAFHA
jgi:hypothetical protein